MTEEKKVTLKVNDNGSLRITGDVELLDGEGNPFPHKPAFSLCLCGASKNKPFCDGSHKTNGYVNQVRVK
ncbi:CDGSH iron-sulfur domain-containing protein [Bacillus sp. FJAT-45037]|uniref:CDGSH iron-sulfur domain-containing protein n=1 Tax=Bacillus sp. FJAT-45037 TaxID=2011007 RepID=UPI000C2504DF|nr:CDGSH iron-sulfur domain-containing protein [Bacillus sp. FJAT-45037]